MAQPANLGIAVVLLHGSQHGLQTSSLNRFRFGRVFRALFHVGFRLACRQFLGCKPAGGNARCHNHFVSRTKGYAVFAQISFFGVSKFVTGEVGDPAQATSVLACLSADSREEVDRLVSTAIAAGGKPWLPAQDHGVMYGASFADPDGNVWEVMWMDPAAIAG